MRGPLDEPIAEVQRRVAGAVRSMVAGRSRPPERLHTATDDDPGLFGPGSAAWQVHGDVAMFVGGLRALLLQTLHPLAMAGVAEHSDYRRDPWGRLRRTAEYVGATTYGSTDTATAAISRVRRIHEHVRGVAPDGRPYAATDPHLIAWVHVTEVDSFLRAYQRYGSGRLEPGDADRYVAEMATVAELLGSEPVPTTVSEMRTWIRDVRPELSAGRQAHDAVRFLLVPPVPLVARGPYGVVAAAAVGLLPAWARRQLWLPSPPLSDPLVVQPTAKVLLASLGWALRAEPA